MPTFPDVDLPLQFEAAFGADPEASPGTWAFTSLTSRLLDDPVRIQAARVGEGTRTAQPSSCTVAFDNDDAELTPLRALSTLYPNIKLDTPFRAKLRRADDAFTRTVSNGWGTSTSGHAWTVVGGAASDYSTSGTQGSVAVGATTSDRITVVDLDGPHQDARITATTNGTPAGGSIETGIVARYTDANNHYIGVARIATSGAITAVIAKRVTGTLADIATASTGLSTGTNKRVRFQVIGDRLRLKIWLTSATEPDDWDLDLFDESLTVGDWAGSYSRRNAGNSSPTTFTYDDFDTTHHLHEGFTDSWAPDFIPNTDPNADLASIVRVTSSGPLRRLGVGTEPARSPLYRQMLGSGIDDIPAVAFWPMEDGDEAGQWTSPIAGVPDMTIVTPVELSNSSDIIGSAPLPVFGTGAGGHGIIPDHTDTGFWAVQAVAYADDLDASFTVVAVETTGVARYVAVGYAFAQLGFSAIDAEGNTIDAGFPDLLPFEVEGVPVSVVIAFEDDAVGTDDYLYIRMMTADGTVIGSIDVNLGPGMYGRGVAAYPNGRATTHDQGVVGHVTYYTDPAFTLGVHDVANARALGGYDQEQAHERFLRLCGQLRIPASVTPGATSEPMGPELIDTAMANFLDIEATDGGFLGEENFGLSYIPRSARYNRPVGKTINLATLRVREGQARLVLRPVYDDQRFRNVWTVERRNGSSYTARDLSQVKLEYRDYALLNVVTDGDLVFHATWRLGQTALLACRWPNTPVDLAANPEMLGDWLGAVPGLTRIVRTGLPGKAPDGDIDEMLDGYAWTIQRRAWGVTYGGTNAETFRVGVTNHATLAKTQASGSTLTSGINAAATSLSVTIAAGHPLWKTGSVSGQIIINGDILNVTNISGGSSPQTFTVTRTAATAKAHSAGATVLVYRAARTAL